MTEWRKYYFKDIFQIIDGDRGVNYPKQSDLYSEGFCLFLNTGNVTSSGFNFEKNQFITKEKDKMLRKGKLRRGDIVFTTRGTVGNVALYDDSIPYENIRINSGMVILRTNESVANKEFIFQILKSNYKKKLISPFISGSVQPQLPIKDLKEISLPLPPLPEQKAIAEVLSSLDDKIDLLTRQNKTLEDLAQVYFRKWFIEDASDKWEVGKAEDYFEIGIGKTPPRKEEYWFSKNKNDVVWVSISDMGKSGMFIGDSSEYLTKDAVKQFNIKCVPKGAILLSFKLTVGRVAIALRELTTNEAIAYFKYRNIFEREYLYFYLKMFDYYSLGSTSSIAIAVNSKIIKAMPIVMPDIETLKKYHVVASPLFSKIEANTKQIVVLQKLRDTLLPKLISGEIRTKM